MARHAPLRSLLLAALSAAVVCWTTAAAEQAAEQPGLLEARVVDVVLRCRKSCTLLGHLVCVSGPPSMGCPLAPARSRARRTRSLVTAQPAPHAHAMARPPHLLSWLPHPSPVQQVVRLDDGTVVQVQEFRGPPKAAALPHLFSNVRVEVHCPSHKVRR
jgi:hypothetical protein